MAGKIHRNVREPWLAPGGDEYRAIESFLAAGFDVSWAKEFRSHGTDVHCYFLEPDDELKASYGFEYQMLVVVHPYDHLEPRTFQAISHFMSSDPAKGRVEPLVYFLVSKANDVQDWTTSYLLENRDERIAIPIAFAELLAGTPSARKIRDAIHRHYLVLNIFKNTLPLEDDTYFFGRNEELTKLIDSAKRLENIGLFGLRKTGKTSLLFKLRRFFDRDGSYVTVILNAELASVRKRRWHELLHYIATNIASQVSCPAPMAFTEIDAAEQFTQLLKAALTDRKKRLLLIVDEIDWIVPELTSDSHWTEDFLTFWQTIRGVQSEYRKLAIVVAGVSPYAVERDLLSDKPNPLFGIVTPVFLRGFSKPETWEMINKIGKLVGLRPANDALEYLYIQYGGHPLLTRLACSYTFEDARARGISFPVQVNEGGC